MQNIKHELEKQQNMFNNIFLCELIGEYVEDFKAIFNCVAITA